jgi:hypothetical protein
MERTAKQLNLALRDASMFSEGAKFKQRASISVREHKLLVRTELVRAIITRDSAVLFECKCDPDAPNLPDSPELLQPELACPAVGA